MELCNFAANYSLTKLLSKVSLQFGGLSVSNDSKEKIVSSTFVY